MLNFQIFSDKHPRTENELCSLQTSNTVTITLSQTLNLLQQPYRYKQIRTTAYNGKARNSKLLHLTSFNYNSKTANVNYTKIKGN